VGYLNFPFGLLEQYSFGYGIYIDITRQKIVGLKMKLMTIVLQKNFNISAGFFFIVTESIMSWDWIMSIDPHWFSTLFGWYVYQVSS
jgi:hypothetical protein